MASGKKVPVVQRCTQAAGRHITHHAGKSCCGILVFILLLAMIAFNAVPFNLITGGDVFSVRGHPIAKEYSGARQAIGVTTFTGVQAVVQERSEVLTALVLIYEAQDGLNVFTQGALNDILKLESALTQVPEYERFCLSNGAGGCFPAQSPLSFLTTTAGAIVPDINGALRQMQINSAATLDNFVSPSFSPPSNLNSNVTKSSILFGGPLKGYASHKSDVAEQLLEFAEWANTQLKPILDDFKSDHVDLYKINTELLQDDFNAIIQRDMIFAFGSIIFTIIYITFHTRSIFIALLGTLHVIMSFPVAYFIFRFIIMEEWFNFLNTLAIFIVLGIGADDIFIFVDAWKQSALEPEVNRSLETRMAWSYHRAAKAMFVTSWTTALAFFANVVSAIAPIRMFGVFTGFVVLANYVLVITLFPCVVMQYHYFFENRTYKEIFTTKCTRDMSTPYLKNLPDSLEMEEKTPPGESAGSVKEDSSKESSKDSAKDDVVSLEDQQTSKDSKDASTVNAPPPASKNAANSPASAGEELQEESASDAEPPKVPSAESAGVKISPVGLNVPVTHDFTARTDDELSVTKGVVVRIVDASPPAGEDWIVAEYLGSRGLIPKTYLNLTGEKRMEDYRWLERKFNQEYTNFVYRGRYAILFVFFVLFVVFFAFGVQIRPAEEPARFLPDNHPLQKTFDLLSFGFKRPPLALQVNLVWGVEGVDSKGTDPNKAGDLGETKWDEEFVPTSAAAQNWIIATCVKARGQPSTRNGEVFCPLEDVRDYVVGTLNESFPIPAPLMIDRLKQFAVANPKGYRSGTENAFGYSFDGKDCLRFGDDGRLRMLVAVVNTTYDISVTAEVVQPVYKEWKEFVEELNDGAPAGVNKALQVSAKWVQMQTEISLVVGAFTGFAISLLVAYVAMIATTRSVYLSSLALVAIFFVVFAILGLMVMLSWSLGIIESICITLLVGLSVDYIVHLANSYNESANDDRVERARDAVTDMGISIFSALLTTLGASLMLFFTTVLFFVRFGQFIFMTVCFSGLAAFGLFMALVMVAGPPIGPFGRKKQAPAPAHAEAEVEAMDV